MKSEKILNLLKTKNLIIPSFLLINYKKLKITEKELILLSSLIEQDLKEFDPVALSNYLNWSTEEVMLVISSLCDKNIVDLQVKKENKKMKEYLSLEVLYEKILLETIENIEEKEETNSKIYETIEKELGRTLSPIEYETISGWLNSNITEEMIKEALKEAVLNGVRNLKYIDKILYDWNKKGYKKPSDIKRKPKKEELQEDLFEYDWLDEND